MATLLITMLLCLFDLKIIKYSKLYSPIFLEGIKCMSPNNGQKTNKPLKKPIFNKQNQEKFKEKKPTNTQQENTAVSLQPPFSTLRSVAFSDSRWPL
uniref:Uncharacterized protein n=1 Tax=Gossypium raimondii TaxID=29730 RepID=A0A0D2W581_GOSRA|nr:hypothetical protein B456_013G119600 [Gossypium raimondii]KJB80881.1 hypothetical protein B456_013G119600 [Gossypium raimondii]